MAEKPSSDRKFVKFRIALHERKEEDSIPQLTAIAVDANNKPIEFADITEDGKVQLSAGTFDQAAKVLIGAEGTKPGGDAEFVSLHKFQIGRAIDEDTPIELARRSWIELLTIRRCIDGSAEHCEWWPWLLEIANQRITLAATDGVIRLAERFVTVDSVLEPVLAQWKLCKPLCDGVVEVYRRVCCCSPFIIYDPRIPEILRELEELVRVVPPIGPPDPGPLRFEDVRFLRGGAADERAINVDADLKAIKSLPPVEQAAYIQARPYLFCSCSSQKLVASGFLQPDGTFNICWNEPLRLMWLHCHEEYAFVIKQLIDSETVVVYDGVAAGQWFHLGEEIELTSYHPGAIVCDDPGTPPPGTDGTSVMLEAIRSTDSLHLNSPLPTEWDRVPAPSGNDGLAFPAPAAASGTVQWKNVGWGKTLPLRYLFFSDLEPIATYYRISVVKANAAGVPTGTRKYLDQPLSWAWYRRRTDLTIKRETLPLGPAGNDLFRIPYRSLFQSLLAPGEIGEWAFRQFHGFIGTTNFDNGRYLVTLELFDAAQNPIKPLAAPHVGSDPEIPAPFSFQTWDQADLSATVPVNFKALTHLFWWDNRRTDAKILAVRKNGLPSVEECLFLDGPRSTNVSIDYRAEHDEPKFLFWHDLRWKRGLFTAWHTWVAANSLSVDPGTSPNRTYEELLGDKDQCAFTIEVRTRAKITHGSGRIDDYDDRDTGSFAIVSPSS